MSLIFKKQQYIFFSCLALICFVLASCSSRKLSSTASAKDGVSPDSIYRIMAKVADWQIDSFQTNGWKHRQRDWTNAALYTGLLKFGELSNNNKYYQFMKKEVGEKFNWDLYNTKHRYHADFYCVGQMYTRFYEMYKDPKMIADFIVLADTLVNRPHTEPLEWKNHIELREWAWCDALFMAPPALGMLSSATGNIEYLDLADKLWWKTTDYLYDEEEHLYYRDDRFFNKKEKNGEKVFWSRGNGWVIAGLVRVLEYMPENYPARDRWIKLYRDMAAKIASLQQPDGTWRASLLDPASYPMKETSGTGFFTYALAWGINNKMLDERTYSPVVWKAWKSLTEAVHPSGKLGYVQPIGAAPGKVSFDDTEVYGVGAFLLAGTELIDILLEDKTYKKSITISNQSATASKLGDLKRADKTSTYVNILTGERVDEASLIQGGTTLHLRKSK